MARTKKYKTTPPKTQWPFPFFMAEDGYIWKQIEKDIYQIANKDDYNKVIEQWITEGQTDRKKNENLIKTLGHSHIDNYLAAHIASFTYTKPPTSLLETYLD
ncbi:MAG: hypothetical protein CL512_05535 [Actinobacteria bacterium]|nr:hypothetical protein [Actinomycetota bacterium]|tara:strand:- start:4952 stop:5257 length:306 start_codon:yes stop_codon:yes gene_type:complete